jgi:prolyl-tRNA editing enzyme YbaK/EbsC (Cys-tRNA(Pro) deacylase)
VTIAVRALRAAQIDLTPRLYPYVEHGGTAQCAKVLGVNEHTVVKTLVVEILERICINGGKRGFLVEIDPSALTSLLAAPPVRVGI